ncbi:MAG: hypothetical protein IJP61_03805 [Treponema sp.]|nr:hypothetical protein [Treponema sp.]
MRILNESKSVCFTMAAICFAMTAGSALANQPKFDAHRPTPPHMEMHKDDTKVKKAGQVVALQIDPETNVVSATIAIGTLNKPEMPAKNNDTPDEAVKDSEVKKERPKIITLGEEKVKVDLDDSVKVVSMKPPKLHKKFDRNQNDCCCCGNNGAMRMSNEHRGYKKFNGKSGNKNKFGNMKKTSGKKSLKVGEIVQVVYSDDGTKIEKIVPFRLPKMPAVPRR